MRGQAAVGVVDSQVQPELGSRGEYAICLFGILFFFFNDTATTEIYTLSLHDALPILRARVRFARGTVAGVGRHVERARSEEHTSELQSRRDLVCRLLLEKKKKGR